MPTYYPINQTINMKLNQTTLDKLEDILGESEYVVRYERGNFQSGWCLLESRRIVVLNKFLNLEARINTLLELIPQLDIQFDKLTHHSQKMYEEVKKLSLTLSRLMVISSTGSKEFPLKLSLEVIISISTSPLLLSWLRPKEIC